MKRYSLFLNLIVAAGLIVAQPSIGLSQTPRQNDEARRLFKEGEVFQGAGNLVEAEKKFREALRRFPRAEGADKTAYFLINTLSRLGRVQEARSEIENFRRTYPQSKWRVDVSEATLALGGYPAVPAEANIWNSPAELREAQARADRMLGLRTPAGPPNRIYSDDFPPNASTKAEDLRQIIRSYPDVGIEEARRYLIANPSDPAVIANLGTIANSESHQALPFLLSIWGNAAASPNARNLAFFWFSRRNPEKEEVAKAIMDLLTKDETEKVASEALRRMTVADHRAVLEKIVRSSNPQKFALIDKIYRNGSVLLKSDLLMFVARLDDPRAVPFIVNAAQNDSDPAARLAAAQALGTRKDIDRGTLQTLIKPAPATPRGTQPARLMPAGNVILGLSP
jgi:hypothetical protein